MGKERLDMKQKEENRGCRIGNACIHTQKHKRAGVNVQYVYARACTYMCIHVYGFRSLRELIKISCKSSNNSRECTQKAERKIN